MGNLNSVCKKLSLLNVKATIAKEPNDLFGAEKLILPGVGHFENAINKLKSLRIYDTLNEVVLVKKGTHFGNMPGDAIDGERKRGRKCRGPGLDRYKGGQVQIKGPDPVQDPSNWLEHH